MTIHDTKREGAKRLRGRIKAPDIVCALLDEPDLSLRIYRRSHNAILPVWWFPGRDHTCVRSETGKAIGRHLADPHVPLRIHCWLHQANVGRRKWKEVYLRHTHDYPGCRRRCCAVVEVGSGAGGEPLLCFCDK